MLKQIFTFSAVTLLISGCSMMQLATHNPLLGEWRSATSEATLRFDENRVSGSDGCNRYGSAYTASADTLTISDQMMSTMMACESNRMKSADQFRQSLMATKRYRSDGKILTLLGASGEVLGEFLPAGK
ncbi:META domain-containing protein [Sulfuricurvum sp.]|uniref:META domain-containing protein n=1 Tax=Sulfuricurvum sp. TaxID=2025608 RepID=UPI0026148096|nr:META domain-containing protein [Sulfuricurvum sp.]MDD2782381.1 META domain-containing protein [Sulfuricurvum sp.]